MVNIATKHNCLVHWVAVMQELTDSVRDSFRSFGKNDRAVEVLLIVDAIINEIAFVVNHSRLWAPPLKVVV